MQQTGLQIKVQKNTRPNVAIASASHARGLTIFDVEFHIHIKHTSQFLLKEYLSGKKMRMV